MKVLVAYASNSGNTRAAAQLVGEVLQEKRFQVSVQDVVKTRPEDVAAADVVILGSNTWLTDGEQGQPPSQMKKFAASLQGQRLTDKPFAIFVFGRSDYTHFAGSADFLTALVGDLGGRLLGPVLKVDGFFHHHADEVREWTEELTKIKAI